MDIIKINIEDKLYPQRLLKVRKMPTEIYAMGNIELLNTKSTIGIVGSRNCTDYGRKVAKEFAEEFSSQGICVISGMAMGIDGAAHNASIDGAGKTIAVLGGGFNYIYPKENEWLFYKILANGGCVISEYTPNEKPDKGKFPFRNRIISGLSDAVLVVEAIHRSGSTITAKYAKNEGKPVYAIPSNIYSSTGIGTNRLIQEGAILTSKPKQIIENFKNKEYGEKVIGADIKTTEIRKKSSSNNRGNDIDFSETQNKNCINKTIISKEKIDSAISKEYLEIYKILSEVPIHINEIARKLNKEIREISPVITMMEIDGYIVQTQINYFARAT